MEEEERIARVREEDATMEARSEGGSTIRTQPPLLALNAEEGTTSQRMWATSV